MLSLTTLWCTFAIAPRETWIPFCAMKAVGPMPSTSLNPTSGCEGGAGLGESEPFLNGDACLCGSARCRRKSQIAQESVHRGVDVIGRARIQRATRGDKMRKLAAFAAAVAAL